jgi:hypothetical protein
MTLTITDATGEVRVADGEVALFHYVYEPGTPQLESPKPYLHPIRTRAGRLVSLFRPWDHVWHKGLSWSLPVVADENFWGGPTFVKGRGYVQLPNNGAQQHRRVQECTMADGVASFAHALEWITQQGRVMFDEERRLTARVLDDALWGLTFETRMTNVTDSDISIGSPTTRGRENAGYGGLFWRGPRSFTDGTLVTADGTGSGDEVRGQRHAWMGFAGRHDVVDASSLVVMVDAADNPAHVPQWFARSREFAALNPAPFFSEELIVPAGGTVAFRYAVGIADAGAPEAGRIAARVGEMLP